MSTGPKMKLLQAQYHANDFISLIADVTKAEVCGSVRRLKPLVGDIEIVCLPDDRRVLMARLDRLVADGTFRKAAYGTAESERWGDTYRGLMFEGFKVEVFCATRENHGYIKWLRTGPGDANTHCMTRMKQTEWSVRFREGCAWHMKSLGQAVKLDCSGEDLLYAYLGMPNSVLISKPELRCVEGYVEVCRKRPNEAMLREHWIVEAAKPQQSSLF